MTEPFGKYPGILISVMVLFFAGTATTTAAPGMSAATGNTPATIGAGRMTAPAPLRLTDREKAWLAAHKTIRVGFDSSFPPYSFLDDAGNCEGLAVDMLQLLARRIGVTIKPIPKAVWTDLYAAAKRREVDAVATMGRQPQREKWFVFTRPYLFKSLVIMTRQETTAINRPGDLAGRSVALVKKYQYVKPLLTQYPSVKPYYVDTMLDGLNAVAVGKADAAITFLGAGHYLKTKYQLANLKFAAVFDRDHFTESIAVRKDWPELAVILDKALASINNSEKAELRQRWIGQEHMLHIALRTLFQYLAAILGFVLLLVSGFVIWNSALKKQVRRKTAELRQELAERKKTEDENKRINEKLRAVNGIIVACASTMETEEMLSKVMDEALQITGLEGGVIYVASPDQTLRVAARRATSAAIGDLPDHAAKIGDCLCGECARGHKPLVLADREAVLKFSTRETTCGGNIRFHAAFPLISVERCMGVLCVFTRTDKKPSAQSLQLLETVSAQIAMAIDNAQLYAASVQQALTLEDKVRERTADLDKARRDLLNLVADLNRANEKLQELDRLKAMFIASMSHELRTPLNSIIGFTGIILQGMTGGINDEQRDQLERVFRAGKHLLLLITDVIDIAKIESGKIVPYAGEFLLGGVIDEACDNLKVQIAEKGLELRKTVPETPIRMKSDRRRILQCLLNFLSNAVKFTVRGTVTVAVKWHKGIGTEGRQAQSKGRHEMSGGFVEISVTDTGIGIREEDMPRLFQSFVRFESQQKTTTPGTGLGLYLTKKLTTEVLGGELWAASRAGEGSVFTLRLPVILT
ncbi:diguanylate cyclase/phosphodiesterase (GGDEF & EAL domains) with PAS/PAC sensor(s) [hydrothermal vent metagenome]|uniref:histidine kinase n=1 Tax=hydrothermal vent metagenome TaxID=652676 RepID=A0A3B0V9K1_9ZZZZ